MDILIRLEEKKDYRWVEEVTKLAFSESDRIERGQIGCPYEHWMVNELNREAVKEFDEEFESSRKEE